MTEPFILSLETLLDEDDVAGALALARSMHAADLAEAINAPDSRVRDLIVLHFDPEELAAALAYVTPHSREDALQGLAPEVVADVLSRLPDDVATDVVQDLPPDEAADVVAALDAETREAVGDLLAYPEDTAGGRMTGQRLMVAPDLTVAGAIEFLRELRPDIGAPFYVYVAGRDGELLGVVNLRSLVTSAPDRGIGEVMDSDIISVQADADQEEAARLLRRYRLLALPVVDAAGRLVGTVTSDDLLDVLEEEATEDIQKAGGVSALDFPYFATGSAEMLRKRGGWLSVLFLSEMLTATAMGFFEQEIERAVVLAIFIPLIISSGGNAGSQASTLVIRAMALGEVRPRDLWRVFRRELGIGLMLGALLAAIGALRVIGWEIAFGSYGDLMTRLSLTVAISLVGVVAWGALAGSTLPFALRKLQFDPASASAPFVATVVDVTGLIIYFTVAKFVLLGNLPV